MTEDIVLTDTQKELLDLMFYYRCATPIQLAAFVYGPSAVKKSNEKYVYNQLAKMEDAGLVLRYKPHVSISRHAVYYLSKKGFDYKLNQLSLPIDYIGAGWMDWESFNNGAIDYGHFDYGVYKPPLRQLQHHLLMIETLLVMHPLEDITYRNNLYARRTIRNGNARTILRADAEFKINDEVYTVEIDRTTESHEQLVAKFENYFHYSADYRSKNGHFDIQHILFVVDAPIDGHLNRRWTNILAAYYKAMRGLADKFELHLVTLDNLEKFLLARTNIDIFKQPFEKALLATYNLQCNGKKELIDDHYKLPVLTADAAKKQYVLRYQIIATPYSTLNLKLRLATFELLNPTYYYVSGEPYIADKLDAYLTDTDKDYIRDALAKYKKAQEKPKLIELK